MTIKSDDNTNNNNNNNDNDKDNVTLHCILKLAET